MIQRKQTLFLLAVFLIAVILFFIPFQTVTIPKSTWLLCLLPNCSKEVMSSNIYIPMGLNALIVVLSMFTIFKFKKRVLQYKLSMLLTLINVFIMGMFFLLSFTKAELQGSVSFSAGAFLPMISAIFAFLAAHFIKKDEQLVRSADRIR